MIAAGRRLVLLGAAAIAVVLAIGAMHHSGSLHYAPLADARRAGTQLADVVVTGRRNDLVTDSVSNEQRSYQLPQRLLSKLQGHTVHVDPYETALVSAYGLDWRPLPILQAYSAYTSYLDQHNAAFLRSDNAPDRVVRQSTAFDVNGRGRELEAPAEFRQLICSDVQIGVSPKWQVLAHVPSRCLNSYRISTVTTAPGVPVRVPLVRSDAIVIAHIKVGDTFLNKLRGLVWKPHVPYISLSGGPYVPLVAATGDDGIVLHVPATAGWDPRFGGAIDWTTIAVSGRPGSVRIEFDAVPVLGIVPPPSGEQSQRPLPAYVLQHVTTGDVIRGPGGETYPVEAGGGFVDYAFRQQDSLVLQGWSANAATGDPASQILVYSDGKLVFAGHPNTARPDVAAALGHPQLTHSGYQVLVPIGDVLDAGARRHLRIFSIVGPTAYEVVYPPSYGWR